MYAKTKPVIGNRNAADHTKGVAWTNAFQCSINQTTVKNPMPKKLHILAI